MQTMQKVYAGFVRVPMRWSRPTTCYVRIYTDTTSVQLPVVIATELGAGNGGMSVTNACEYVAASVWRTHLPEERRGLVFIEHYHESLVYGVPPVARERGSYAVAEESTDQDADKDTYSRVDMTLDDAPYTLRDPEWQRLRKSDVEALIAQPVDDLEDLEDLRHHVHRSRGGGGQSR